MNYLYAFLLMCAVLLSTVSCSQKEIELKPYPETKKVDTVDIYHGTEVPDHYRWLEDDLSDETVAWVEAQNEVTFDYLEQIPFRSDINERLTGIWNYEKLSAPTRHGDYYYFSKNDGLQNQSVLYRTTSIDDIENAEVFLDPNTFSEDGTTSLAGISFTEDGDKVVYMISEGGSDWRKIIIRDTQSMEQIGDTLIDVKFSGLSWKGNEGFFYSSYDKPEGSELSAKTQNHKLFYHKLNTPQSQDQLVFGGEETPRRYIFGGVTEDDRYLIISASVSTTGNELYYKDLRRANNPVKPLVSNFDNDHSVVDNIGSSLLIETNFDAPNGRLVKVDLSKPSIRNWKDVIPESEYVLSVSNGGGYLFANYMVDVKSEVFQYTYEGKRLRKIELPGIGTTGGFSAKKDDSTLYYRFTSFTYPASSFRYNIETGNSELYWTPEIDFNPEAYTTEQVFYKSKDGTEVPMFITHKKGIELNGKNPTYLYGYGGFNVSLQPSFSIARLAWLEQGGVYAQPNIRGGGEYGQKWHLAGTKLNKQNVFDDFIAAAEYLIGNGYTNSERLALAGGSNGGLLVGGVMTQRPDLASVALPAVGVLDMLRYHTFTAGAGWAYDYGTAEESKEMFEYLLNYSPVHNVEEGVAYPATMVTTADHDDRVVPAHSFKFISELQDKHAGENPVIIRIATNAGHGAGKPTSMIIQEWADKYAFTWWNMGFEPEY